MDKKITKIIFRQDEKSNMNSVVLAEGEPAIAREIVNGQPTYTFKIGDGRTSFNQLPTISASHTIEEPLVDGEYLRKKQGDNYSWVTREDNRKIIADLLSQNYDVEYDMGYDIKDASGNTKHVYGIRKSFIVSVDANVKDIRDIQTGVHNIVEFGGSLVASNNGKYNILSNNDMSKSCLYITPDNIVKLETTTVCDRLDNLVDVWVTYTKI